MNLLCYILLFLLTFLYYRWLVQSTKINEMVSALTFDENVFKMCYNDALLVGMLQCNGLLICIKPFQSCQDPDLKVYDCKTEENISL